MWVLLLTSLLVAAAPAVARAVAAPILRVGMDTRSVPWAFVPGLDYSREDPLNPPQVSEAQLRRLDGFEIEILKALGEKLGVEMKVVPTAYRQLESQLLAGRYDLILGAWTPSAKTPDGILASAPYYQWGLLMAVRANDPRIHSYRDLAGLRVGHIPDPAVERGLLAMEAGLEAQFVAVERGGPELFEGLQAGTFDAILFDSPYVRWRVAQDHLFRVVGEPLNRLGYHVGVRRDDQALYDRVQAALKDLTASGLIRSVRERWER